METYHTIGFTEDDLERLFVCIDHTIKSVDDRDDVDELLKLRSLVMKADR